jgi:PAS domain S-box-containing protein
MKVMSSLTARWIAASVAIILLAIVIAGIPAYLLLRRELEQQLWQRVEDGALATRSLLQAEGQGMSSLAGLGAQRPTLRQLVVRGEQARLEAYLESYRQASGIDLLAVCPVQDGRTGPGAMPCPWPLEALPAGAEFVADGNDEIWLVAAARLLDDPSAAPIGYVVAGTAVDEEFARRLKLQTGLEHSLFLNVVEVASSLSEAGAPLERERTGDGGSGSGGRQIRIGDAGYFAVAIPLDDMVRGSHLTWEVAVPISGLEQAERRTLILLTGSAILVGALASWMASLAARRLNAPLQELTAAAARMRSGDLSQPIPLPPEPEEVTRLAAALEDSRSNLEAMLLDLQRAKAWSETIIQSVGEGIATIDRRGVITSFNPGAERLTGWAAARAVGRPISGVLRTPSGEAPLLDLADEHGRSRQVDLVSAQGQVIHLAVTLARIEDRSGSTGGAVLVLRDVTEEEAAQSLRAYFLANISHEFRTPLSALSASVELLLDELEDLKPAETARLLGSIQRSVTGLQALIDNLLESMSIEAGRFRIRRRQAALADILQEAVRTMKPLLDRRQQVMQMTIQPDLPALVVDPVRITQVLVNLLSNASKYSPIQQTIEVSAELEAGPQVCVAVADRGPGVSPEDRQTIFKRFMRARDADPAQYGVGLGLSVVKAIIEEHDGSVGVDDRPGGGARFWFRLPAGLGSGLEG